MTRRKTPDCDNCTRKGQTHDPSAARCQAHTRAGQCRKAPILGGRVCYTHGGATRVAREKANERLEQARLGEELARAVVVYGAARDVSPTEAMLDEVKWTAGHVAWLREQVQRYRVIDLQWGITEKAEKHATEFTGTDTTWKAVPPVLLLRYDTERRLLIDMCAAVIRAGVEERLVNLATVQGQLLGPWLRWFVIGFLSDLGLEVTPERWEFARLRVTELLTGLGAMLPPPDTGEPPAQGQIGA